MSTAQGGSDTPANQRILSAPASWQVIGTTATLDLATIFPNQWENILIRARVSSTSLTTGNGSEVTDRVRFFVNMNGTGFPATADLTITGNNNARWGYTTGTGIAITTAGTPATFTPTSGGNLTTQGYSYAQIAVPAGTGSIALRVIANNNDANEVWSVDNIEVIGNSCPNTYYSQASGNISNPIWSNFPGGTPGPALINEGARIVIQNGFAVTNNANTNVNDLIVQAGGTLILSNDFALNIHGDTVSIAGNLVGNEGVIGLVGANTTSLIFAVPVELYDLVVGTPAGTAVSGTLGIHGSLTLSQGSFNATAADVTLLSTGTGTGRLAEVPITASYQGDLTVQRYIPGGATNWRLLGSPVGGATIADWDDDFYTAGFPGSDYPGFVVQGDLWPSIRYYDETITGPDWNAGVLGVEGIQTVLQEGRGYAVWSGDELNGTASFTIDVTGPPNIAQDPIDLQMTFTDSGNPAADGYNLVSNPVPSAIAFSSITRGADVPNSYQLYDPATGNHVAWSNGFGMGAANGIIQSSQGFWLKATGPAATAQVEESDKIEQLQGGAFGGLMQPNAPMVRLKISSSINTFSDESLIVFDLGTPAQDPQDVMKLIFAHPDAPQIATRSSDGKDLQIDLHGAYSTDISIPITVQVAISGTYALDATLIGMNGLSCLSLEDLSTGEITPFNEATTYTFDIQDTDDWDTPRFILHASAPIQFETTDLLCAGDDNGAAEIQISGEPVDVTWTDPFGTIIDQANDVSGAVMIDGLVAGSYMIMVEGVSTSCGTLIEEFTINAPYALEAAVENTVTATCPDAPDGSISILAMGGAGPYEYAWSNGSTDQEIVDLPGAYSATVTDANGCNWTSGELLIGISEDAPSASFTVEGTDHEVNVPIDFINTSTNTETLLWNFGDGSTGEDPEPSHSFSEPGIYLVSLTVQNGSCTIVHSQEISVQTSTAINDRNSLQPANAWVQGDHMIVEHNFTHGEELLIDVLDATGKLFFQKRYVGTPGRIMIPLNTISSGVWFVRISNGNDQQTFKIPFIR